METGLVWKHACCTVRAEEVAAARAAAPSSAALRNAGRLLPCCRREAASVSVSGMSVGPACHAMRETQNSQQNPKPQMELMLVR